MKSRNDEGTNAKLNKNAAGEFQQRDSTANDENINDTSRMTPRIAVNNSTNQQQ